MTFDEAVKKSIKTFLAGKSPMQTGQLAESGLFYTPDFFDEPTDSKKTKDEELTDAT